MVFAEVNRAVRKKEEVAHHFEGVVEDVKGG